MQADKAIKLGHPSYVWRDGQERRLEMIRSYVTLENARILDAGCGLGLYVRRFREVSDRVYGVDIDPDRVAEASLSLPNIRVASAEALPFPPGSDCAFSGRRFCGLDFLISDGFDHLFYGVWTKHSCIAILHQLVGTLWGQSTKNKLGSG